MKVYADHAATTPMRPEAKKAMIEALEDFGNPSSIHALGRLASAKMESARKEIAELLNCRPAEVYFTSGGSEADNWAIRAARYGAGDVVASAFEHHAVLHTVFFHEFGFAFFGIFHSLCSVVFVNTDIVPTFELVRESIFR